MSGGELALETQLLLEEATQITQHVAIESILESASAPPVESEFEAAKSALLAKLRKKKEVNRAQHQQLNQRRLNVSGSHSVRKQAHPFSPRKALNLPVAATTVAASRKQLDMLSKLRTQAIQQVAQNLATMFGYATYEEHLKSLDERDKEKKVIEEEKTNEEEEETPEEKEGETNEEEDKDIEMEIAAETTESSQEVSVVPDAADGTKEHLVEEVNENAKVVLQRNKVQGIEDATEDDGHEADSEPEEKEDDDGPTAPQCTNSDQTRTYKDKAAGYRNLLRAEALQNRRRKRRDNFVESEAEEEEEEDALKIGGLGDFGFGVPQAKTQESKEAEEERDALKIRQGDLDHIVDELSDDERAEEQDLEEMFRREQENQDRQQVKEVMRNVKEGFGRNRRAFSGLHASSEARGRFNLDELVAADGNKFEAARLGLLESDEELSDAENGKTDKVHDGSEREEGEDEEAEMERMLRERFHNQPKIYVTSSESGSDDENEAESKEADGEADEIESDEERERQQIKLFSERARINRRMQRMKDLQHQIALKSNQNDLSTKSNTAMPNLLLEEDEDSQELMHMMNRTNVDTISRKKPQTDLRSKFKRLHSFDTITSSSSSFSRVVGHCKLFSANSTGTGTASSKGFVFTSSSNDKSVDTSDETAQSLLRATPAAHQKVEKQQSWSSAPTKRRTALSNAANACNKKRKSSDLISVLSSYQCVQTQDMSH